MPRILIAECKQEVSSFNPAPSHLADFRIVRGDQLLAHHRSCREEVGGALSVLEQDDSARDGSGRSALEIVPTFGASANTSGGILTRHDFAMLCDQFVHELRAAGPVDAAYLSLHGAMQAENEDDPEGRLLELARDTLGDAIPFVVSLDLHGILTDKMLRLADACVAYHTYPHVDFFETGARAARALLRILRDGARPVTARVKIPALVRGDELITATGAVREAVDRAIEIEAGGALSAAVMWGNPFTDVPELRSNAFVVTDGDAESARQLAVELAERFWRHHDKMRVPLVDLAESVRRAAEVTRGTVVLMDAADATSSGATGDSNAILRELLRQGYNRSALVPIFDPATVERALRAGIGATIETTVGGAFDPRRFDPLPLRARVRLLSDGRFRSESFGWPWDSGPTAVLSADNITLVVGTRPVSLFDRSWFHAHGQDPRRFDLVVVKSPHCEPHMFADWCARLIHVDAPGATSANVRALGHRQCQRPLFPLDEIDSFTPQADIFQR